MASRLEDATAWDLLQMIRMLDQRVSDKQAMINSLLEALDRDDYEEEYMREADQSALEHHEYGQYLYRIASECAQEVYRRRFK